MPQISQLLPVNGLENGYIQMKGQILRSPLPKDGNVVVGVYAYDSQNYKSNGKIEGNLSSDGKILSGIWTEIGEYVYSAEKMASIQSESTGTPHENFTESDDGNTTLGSWDETGTFNFTLSDDGKFWNGTFVYASDNP